MKDIPAFPNLGDGERYDGMTIRDYLAGQALALGGEFFRKYANGCYTAEHISEAAYQIADAMLTERSKGAV